MAAETDPQRAAAKPDLGFVQTAGTASGLVEVKIARARDGYVDVALRATSTLKEVEAANGTLQLEAPTSERWPALYFVQTAGVAAVTVHRDEFDPATGNYLRRAEQATLFTSADRLDGSWQMYSPSRLGLADLYFVKTQGVATVEVHAAGAASGYQQQVLEAGSDLSPGGPNEGTWQVGLPNVNGWPTLYFIRTAGTEQVELHWATYDPASNRYLQAGELSTGFPSAHPAAAWRLSWPRGAALPALYAIRDEPSPSGWVGIDEASADSQFQVVGEGDAPAFAPGAAGVWCPFGPTSPPSPPELRETTRATLPPDRERFALCSGPGALWAIGGVTASVPNQELATLSMLPLGGDGSPGEVGWSELGTPMPTARYDAAAIPAGDKLYVAGGIAGGNYVTDFAAYDIVAETWAPLPPMPGSQTGAAGFADRAGNIHVVGGYEAAFPHMVFDVSAQAWSAPGLPPKSGLTPGIPVSSARVGSVVYIVGSDGGGCAFDLASAQWQALPALADFGVEGVEEVAVAAADPYLVVLLEGNNSPASLFYDTVGEGWLPAPPAFSSPAGATASFSAGERSHLYFFAQGEPRMLTFAAPERPLPLQEALVADTLGYMPFDGTLADFTNPALAPGGELNTSFTPRWDGREALRLEALGKVGLPAFGVSGQPTWPGYTIAAWYRAPNGIGASQGFQLFGDEQTVKVSVVGANSETQIQLSGEWGSRPVSLPGNPVPGKWYHLALAVEFASPTSSTVKTYIDGELVDTWSGAPLGQPVDPFLRATVETDPSSPLVDVANLVVLKRALSADEAMFLACDGYHPEGTFSSTIEYLGYNPAGDSVQLTDSPAFNPGKSQNGLAVTAWVNVEQIDVDAVDGATIIERGSSFAIGIDADARPWGEFWGAEGPVKLQATAPLGERTWSFIGLSLGPQKAELYVDGGIVDDAPAPSGGYSDVASATPAIGKNWPSAIYGIGTFGSALSAGDFRVRMAETIEPKNDPKLLAYYDFSVNPPLARSPDPALAGPLTLPDGGAFEQFTQGVALGLDARVDAGAGEDTVLSSGRLPLYVSAWVQQAEAEGYQTLVGRSAEDGGYLLSVRDGFLEAAIVDPHGATAVARSRVPLPRGQFSQVGALLLNEPSGYTATAILNGRIVGEAQTVGAPTVETIGADAPLLIGAQNSPPRVAGRSFTGLVQSLSIYTGQPFYPYALYFEPSTLPAPTGNWAFDMEAPLETTGNHPADLRSGAYLVPFASSDHLPTPTLSPAQKLSREQAWEPEWRPPPVPPEHADILRYDPAQEGLYVCHQRDGVTYVVLHGGDGEERAECVFAEVGLDPTTVLWIGVMISIVAVVVRLLYQGTLDKKAALGLMKAGWDGFAALRTIGYALATAAVAEIPALIFSLFSTLYNCGLLGNLLRCCGFSYFSVLRIAASFAPFIGAALMLLALKDAAEEIQKAIEETGVKKDQRPPNVSASAPPSLTLNGDPVEIEVMLDGPSPAGAATVTAKVEGSLVVVRGGTLTLSTPGVPQATEVQARGPVGDAPVNAPTTVLFDSTDAVPPSPCELEVLVAKLVCDPATIELELSEDEKNYEGSFTISVTAPPASDSPLTVSFEIEGKPVAETDYVFDPSTVTLENAGQLSAPKRVRVDVSLPVAKKAKQDQQLVATAKASRQGTAGDTSTAAAKLRARDAEEISVTMVDAGAGNAFVVKNTVRKNKTSTTRYAVIDGGVPGSAARILGFLPGNEQVDLYCSHYDQDHIAGLLELLRQASFSSRIGRVVFNPPPPGSVSLLRELRDAGAPFTEHLLGSVKEGNELKAAAAGKLKTVQGVFPPPTSELAGIDLPSLAIRWAGPRLDVWARLIASPSSTNVNRASLLFALASKLSSFTFLQTGDGYDTLRKPDVRGWGVRPNPPVIDFFQVPHHGSRHNSKPFVYAAFPARNYLISTDWVTHHHPHVQTILHILAGRPLTAGPFNIYINTPNLPVSRPTLPTDPFHFPPGPYIAYKRRATAAGITFTYTPNGVTVDPTTVEQCYP